jgi:hypothetical protein
MQGLGDRTQEGLLGQIRNDGIVDLKQDAVFLFTFSQRLFRLFRSVISINVITAPRVLPSLMMM